MPARKQRTEFPAPGAILTRNYRKRKVPDGRIYEAKVVSINRETGRVTVELEGKIYGSLSGAARSITGFQVDGWIFWGLEPGIKRRT